jgi:hypothetical protein
MKKMLAVMFAAALLAAPAIAEKKYAMDDAIRTVAQGISSKLPAKTKVVIIDIKAEKPEMTNYIIEKLASELLQIGKVSVIDRQNLDLIRKELALQTSGDVSDDSAQRLGAMLGAEVLVTGSFESLPDTYRMAMKAVQVETAEIHYLSSMIVVSDSTTEALYGRKTGASKAVASVGTAVSSVADFSGRFVCMVINPVFGLGSFIQGDIGGGGSVLGWEVAGGALAYWGDSKGNETLRTVGGGIVVITAIYSLVKPWTYNRAPAVAKALDNVVVEQTSADTISLGYKINY